MLESERKKQRLTDIITHWCEHTKIKPYLREYDIPSLVRQCLEEFYHISLCCGHLVNDFDEGILIEFYEYDDHSKGTIQGIYCKECAERYKKEFGAWEVKDDKGR